MTIDFNRPYLTGNEISYILEAHKSGQLAGDGLWTQKCHRWLETKIHSQKALLTHSCTAALEMTALLLDIKEGDEIIMPSYTFVSTANAYCLRGAIPVFVDIRPDTLNLDEDLIENAITKSTKAIVLVHYAGISCEMDKILEIGKKYGIKVIEDAAQGIGSTYKEKPLGSMGAFGCLSFHETKNIHCGEGGALLIREEEFTLKAEILREKGTNRSQFFRGEVDKYRWIDKGSSYLPGELTAAFLYAQFQDADLITKKRLEIWNRYQEIFKDLEDRCKLRRPIVPEECDHNGHIFYLLLDKYYDRDKVLRKLNEKKISAVFHYQPLHSSPAGLRYSKTSSNLPITEDISERLIRLPIWIGFDYHQRVYDELHKILD